MEPTTPPAGIRKTGLKREHTADPAHGRLKRRRPDRQAPDSSPTQQQESRPYSIIPQQQQQQLYVPVRGDESRRLGSPGQPRAHDTRGIPVNHLGSGNLQGVGTSTTSDQSANYYPLHLSLHQHARHGHSDAPASSRGAHSGTARQENPLALCLSQDTLPPFVSRAARERGVGGYSAGGVPGGQPAEEPQRSPEEPRASPDESSSPENAEDPSPPVVPRGAGVTGTNSVRLERSGRLPNFQTENRGAPSSDASSEESEPSESEDNDLEDDAEGDSDGLEDDQDNSSHLSQGEEADIEIEDAGDVEEESSSEEEAVVQLGFQSHEAWRRALVSRSRGSYNPRTVRTITRTLQASRLDDLDSDTDSSLSSLYTSSSEEERYPPDHGYDTSDELAEEYHRAEFAYDDDDEKAELIRQKYGPPMGTPDSPPPPGDDAHKGRRALRPREREDVKNTRLMGACVRCRMQKIKCNTDQNRPKGECISCKAVHKESPKLIRFMPCQRLKIADLVLYRCGGLNLTRRWKGIQMRDVSDRLDNTPTVIKVSQGLCRKPLLMRVVRFKPRAGDVTARYWTDTLSGKETFKKKELASYCLHDIVATAEAVERYTIENAVPAFIDALKNVADKDQEVDCIYKTDLMALKHYMSLTEKSNKTKTDDDIREAGIMLNLFTLWCAIRHTTGSFYIVGEEKLGMLPEYVDISYPLIGRVSVPRMIVAQFDTLNYVWVLERFKNKLLRDIDWLLLQKDNRWWFTLYLIVFILLREASVMTLDRYRHARANFGSKLRYSIPTFVESLHGSCNNILTHWHYRNKHPWPRSPDPKTKKGTFLNHLTDEQYTLIQETLQDPEILKQLAIWEVYKKENGKIEKIKRPQNPNHVEYTGKQDKFDWDHPYYWVAQLFEPDWQAHPTYQREPVPKSAASLIIS
ncbi:Zn(2)-C6 fungal-type domain-containing protein [Fusarium falciforme]|uniref:Zn(2)-C6 fungal-type domain-containing protein n=1 Tax=Fusarium falciforme TaxID=195108 RepID=UPI00230134AE|nr:Zn(2)-C6 fungal-type domain-containing protein [Fusarium falciforme]WAO95186.1 Zn(2)-C6 fungal-type domain-containing protein [Fusarium falciforme]